MALERYATAALTGAGVEAADAAIAAEALVAADLRGIPAHGIARLDGLLEELRHGRIVARPNASVIRETPTSLLVDAGNGLGQPVARRTMEQVVAKAAGAGAAFGAVRHSNDFGIAGFYAMLALEHDAIGIASTNSPRLAVPTFGREILLGANPLAFAIPAGEEAPFVLDFATADAQGVPLGGPGAERGGHKGYGLGLLVDILCGVCAGGPFGADLPPLSDGAQPGTISHFFAAFTVDGFRDVAGFKADMDTELRTFKDAQRSAGADRIYVAGEREFERAREYRKHGIPVPLKVWAAVSEQGSRS